jgi:hypothetical protein
MEDIRVPCFYTTKNDLNDAEIGLLIHAFRITPIQVVLVSDAYDTDVAHKIHDSIILTSAPFNYAKQLYQKTGIPCLIIEGEELLVAHYIDETHEKVNITWQEAD